MAFLYHYEIELMVKGVNTIGYTSYHNVNIGGIGVFLFFILSGYCHALSEKKEFNAVNYYKKRWLSIFPQFYLAYLMAFIAMLFISPAFFNGKQPWKAILTLFACDGYFPFFKDTYYLVGEWFTTVILFIYLVYPLIRYMITKKPILYFLILGIMDVFFIFNVCNPMNIVLDGNAFIAITAFSIGYVFCTGELKLDWKECILLVAFSLITVYMMLDTVPAAILNMICAICYFAVALNMPNSLQKMPVFRLVPLIAKYSLGIYLTHHFIIRKSVPYLLKLNATIWYWVGGLLCAAASFCCAVLINRVWAKTRSFLKLR